MGTHSTRVVHGHTLRRSIGGWVGEIGGQSVRFHKEGGVWLASYLRAPGHFLRGLTLRDAVIDAGMHLAPDNRCHHGLHVLSCAMCVRDRAHAMD